MTNPFTHYFERVKVKPVSHRILPSLNSRVPWLFPRALLFLPTFVENFPCARTVLVFLGLQK